MKKFLLFALVLFVCLLLDSQRAFTSILAQDENSGKMNAVAESREADRMLAQDIRRLTNRSSEGLVERKLPEGGFLLDLEGRFQNLMLARLESDGEATSACVTSLEEANAFFGRNLETGELVSSEMYPRSESSSFAAEYGMSAKEFDFYVKMIEDAKLQMERPNAAVITIVNGDGAGEGFNDATARATPVLNETSNPGLTVGEQRLNLFQFAANIWGGFLDSNIQIKVFSKFDPQTCTPTSAILGSAGAAYTIYNFTNAEFLNTDYPLALANKRSNTTIGGAGLNQINATFNSNLNGSAGCLGGKRFYYGYDNQTSAATVNLLVVLLHEMGHGLGFANTVTGTTGNYASGRPDIFSRYMFDATTSKYWYQMTDAERQASATNDGNVYWDGANVRNASYFLTAGRDAATGRVKLYTPTSFIGGSSISHFDVSATTNLLMEPNINNGLPINLDLTRQQMRDIGWYRDMDGNLAPDTITNVLPSGGTVYRRSTVNITWTNSTSFNKNVIIELSTDGGATYPTVLASNYPNTGTYSWTVPDANVSTAKIRVREDDFITPLATSVANFSVVTAPTAATVPINGRIYSANGRGIAGARVELTDSAGNLRTAQTNAFGYYRFAEVSVGALYFLNARHKNYRFMSQVINLNEAAEINFTPMNK